MPYDYNDYDDLEDDDLDLSDLSDDDLDEIEMYLDEIETGNAGAPPGASGSYLDHRYPAGGSEGSFRDANPVTLGSLAPGRDDLDPEGYAGSRWDGDPRLVIGALGDDEDDEDETGDLGQGNPMYRDYPNPRMGRNLYADSPAGRLRSTIRGGSSLFPPNVPPVFGS